MHWSVSAGVSKSLSLGKPPRRGWPSVDSLFSFWLFFSFLLSSHFSLLSPHLYSSLLLQFCLYFVPLSFDLPLTLFTCLLTLSLGPEIISHIFPPHLQLCFFSPFFLCFYLLPLQPKWPPVLWDLISLQSKLQSLPGPEIQSKESTMEKEREGQSFATQTHETTVASPPKRQAQQLGPEKLAGPLSTSLRAILNTNRRGLAAETKPWCHAAYFPWKVPGVLGPTPGDMRSL